MAEEKLKAPLPVDTGVDGTQEKAVGVEVLLPLPPRRRRDDEGELATTIEGIAGIAPHKLGGDAMSRLVSGSFHAIDIELNRTRTERDELRVEVNKLKDALSTERISSAVLAEKARSSRFLTVLSNAAISVGALTTGVGLRATSPEDQFVWIVIGGLLMVVGWGASMWPEGK